jgi:hypothetical protein
MRGVSDILGALICGLIGVVAVPIARCRHQRNKRALEDSLPRSTVGANR